MTLKCIAILSLAAVAADDVTPHGFAHEICNDAVGTTLVGPSVIADCYEEVYREAAKAQLKQYTARLATATRLAMLKLELDVWSEFGTTLASAIWNATTDT